MQYFGPSAKIMEEFLIKGKLNPVTNSTQNNFLKIFAAWIIEDDLVFTTGETEGINCLFKFLQTCYQLPSNTTFFVYIIAATLDNATPNDVLIRALSRLLGEKFDIQFVPENSQIRCLAHAVNLVVQKILAALDDADDPAVVENYLPNKDLPIYYDSDKDPGLRDLEQELFVPEINENEEDAAAALLAAVAGTFHKMTPIQRASVCALLKSY
ncbi:hypothetical protein B0H10DRAFT_1853228 [Mycena sp. CBHHK59/15]|nr:hypothetical protein B0H10DRAFT_1853228 [Mycena sp. CBHHK59/15]